MTHPTDASLLLVGSLPSPSTDRAFRDGAALFADRVFALPDGETGPRAAWVGYEDLVARELDRLTTEIPPVDLAIQWDVCYEVLDIEGVLAWTPPGAWERFTGPVGRLTRLIPREALVGYHLCYGTFPEWPMYEARDMELLVRMANHALSNSGRSVDWLHLAGPRYLRSEDDSFFRPLQGLDVGDTRVFLGIVLPIDGVAGLERRYRTASRHLTDFGVAMYCGFGRQPGQDPDATLREHAETVHTVTGGRPS